MVTVAAGMESDFTDSESEIVFSTDKDTKAEKKNNISYSFTDDKPTSNGVIGNSVKKENRNNSRGSSKFRPQNRNRNQHTRRQCLEFETSTTLDDLRYAVMQGNLETTQNIISKGICVDSILKSGWTGLMYACSSGQAEVVSFLLEKNADPNYHKDMFTPLMAVCASKKPEADLLKCFSLLLQHGAKVNAHERHYSTPLMFAVREGHTLIVKELLNHGADVNLQDNHGKTALAWAASFGYGQIVRLLVEKGADVNICDSMGQSPVDLAYGSGHTEVVSLLQKGHFVKENSATELSTSENSTDLVVKNASSVKEVSKVMKYGNSKNFVKVRELELFLSGVGFHEFIPLFLEHQLDLHDLLKMDDTELEKLGITQIGVRKKILEACKSVHKKEWQESSLPNLKQSQYISCPDAVAMMVNIAKHLKFISSSVIYVRQQIQSQPRILELSQDSANVHDFLDEMDDCLKNVHFLNDELRFLKMHLEKVQDQVQYIPADLIVETIPTNPKQRRIIYAAIGMAIVSAAVAGVLWKNNTSVLDLVPSSFVQIKLPFWT